MIAVPSKLGRYWTEKKVWLFGVPSQRNLKPMLTKEFYPEKYDKVATFTSCWILWFDVNSKSNGNKTGRKDSDI